MKVRTYKLKILQQYPILFKVTGNDLSESLKTSNHREFYKRSSNILIDESLKEKIKKCMQEIYQY